MRVNRPGGEPAGLLIGAGVKILGIHDDQSPWVAPPSQSWFTANPALPDPASLSDVSAERVLDQFLPAGPRPRIDAFRNRSI
jgi:hypothetical protein